MAEFFVRMRFPSLSGVPEDVVETGFAMSAANAGALNWLAGWIPGSFNESLGPDPLDPGGPDMPALGTYLSPSLQLSGAVQPEVSLWSVNLATESMTFLSNFYFEVIRSGTFVPWPNEITPVLSLRANGAGPVGRRRGRMYFPPVNTTAVVAPDDNAPSFHGAFVRCLATWGEGLGDRGSVEGTPLSIWSRADAAYKTVSQVSVDNEPDVQRRRGRRGTYRFAANV